MHDRDVCHPNPSLDNKLRKLYDLRSSGRVNFEDNSPYLSLLEDLGNPHLSIPKVVHFAGTNGKGSTIAMVRALLEAQGCAVDVYTSPHLISFNERIVLSGAVVSDDVLESALDHVLSINNGRPCTFFEITTALAFYLFSQSHADYCLLETGMGGRLDCTNVVPNPALSVITPIGLDHQEFLGADIFSIAGEKAGIIKPGVPCVLSIQNSEYESDVLAVVLDKAQTVGSDVMRVDAAWEGCLANLKGRYQRENFATALCVLEQLGYTVDEDVAGQVAQKVCWPARFEAIECEGLAGGCQLWFDGGHNEQAAKAMVDNLKDLHDVALIVGLSGQRKPVDFLSHFVGYVDRIFVVPIAGMQAVSQEDIVREAQTLGFEDVVSCGSVREAVREASQGSKNILVSGSLYLYQETVSVSF